MAITDSGAPGKQHHHAADREPRGGAGKGDCGGVSCRISIEKAPFLYFADRDARLDIAEFFRGGDRCARNARRQG
jgi:hypothetical protein